MKTLCVDFDGVIHAYEQGWTGPTDIPSPPVPHSLEFLHDASKVFKVAIYSSRSVNQKGIDAMQRWLVDHYMKSDFVPNDREWKENDIKGFVLHILEWPVTKPAAFVTLDDRAICFTGKFPALDAIEEFRTWQQNAGAGKTPSVGHAQADMDRS